MRHVYKHLKNKYESRDHVIGTRPNLNGPIRSIEEWNLVSFLV